MKRNFTNFFVWNPTILILQFYRIFGTLEPSESQLRNCKLDLEIPFEEYKPYLKTDGEIPSAGMIAKMIKPFLHVVKTHDCDGDPIRVNDDFYAGYVFTEEASNLILDCIERFKELGDDLCKRCCYNLCKYLYLEVYTKHYVDLGKKYFDCSSLLYERFIDVSCFEDGIAEKCITRECSKDVYDRFQYKCDFDDKDSRTRWYVEYSRHQDE